eukprot:g17533.t1
MLAFRARGRFRANAEDEGEEGAEKGVKKLRAEVSKELGAVPLPKLNEAASGFAWGLEFVISQDCEQRFADLFGDGCVVKVEPFVQVSGILAPPAAVDKTSLQNDLERFAADYGIELRMEDAGGNNVRVHMEGSQSAVKGSKPELQNLMQFYAQAS